MEQGVFAGALKQPMMDLQKARAGKLADCLPAPLIAAQVR